MPAPQRILLVGGYGVVGSRVATQLRRHHPALQLLIAGRSHDKAAELARRTGNAVAAVVDTATTDPLASVKGDIAAVLALVHDHDDNLLRSAVARGLPYIDITRGVAAQTRAHFTASLSHVRAPVMFASNWMAGVPAILAMHLARDLAPIDSVTLSILYDMSETIGPDSADAGSTMSEPFMARVDGAWRKVEGLSDPVTVKFPSGRERPTVRVSMADVITLAQATRAKDVAVRIGIEPARENPGPVSHEIVVEVSGAKGRHRLALLDPHGQAHLTATGVVANLERVLGLTGKPLHPGLCVPETAANGERLIAMLRAEGVTLSGDM
jgi:saccharopine dehydrogenase-like NADP-dependent oxidoreductase